MAVVGALIFPFLSWCVSLVLVLIMLFIIWFKSGRIGSWGFEIGRILSMSEHGQVTNDGRVVLVRDERGKEIREKYAAMNVALLLPYAMLSYVNVVAMC